MSDTRHQDYELKRLLEECTKLREENARFRTILVAHDLLPKPVPEELRPALEAPELVTNASPPEKKLALFRSLFRGREDVYAVRWEKGGKSGYMPSAIMDWRAVRAAKPEDRKRIARQTRSLVPLTEQAIREHLEGKSTIGLYPLLSDDSVGFLPPISTRRAGGRMRPLFCQPAFGSRCRLLLSGPDRETAPTCGYSLIAPYLRPMPAGSDRRF